MRLTCMDCDSDANENCEVCGGEIEYDQEYNVPWTTIKRIYAAAVDLLSAPAPDEREPRLIGYTSQGELENQNERPGPAVTWIAIGNHTIPVYVGGALDAGGSPQ